jgi:flagellar hook-length control protein FliK
MNFTGFHMVNIIDSGAKSSQILSGVITEEKDLSVLGSLFSIIEPLETNKEQPIDEFTIGIEEKQIIEKITLIIPDFQQKKIKIDDITFLEKNIMADDSLILPEKDKIINFAKRSLVAKQIQFSLLSKKQKNELSDNIPNQISKNSQNNKFFTYDKNTEPRMSNNINQNNKFVVSDNKDIKNKNINIKDINNKESKNYRSILSSGKTIPEFSDAKPLIKIDKSEISSEKKISNNTSNKEFNFIKKIKKNNHPNKIYNMNSNKQNNTLNINEELIKAETNNLSEFNSKFASKVPVININNISDKKDNNSFSLNSSLVSYSNDTSNPYSQSNNSNLSNNGFNSVLENLVDHLDLSQKGWTSKLASRITKSFINGGEEIEFNLKPKNLGVLKVSLTLKNGVGKVKIIAENNFVTNALQQNETLLQKLFNDQGINLDFIAENSNDKFQHESNFNQNQDQTKENRKEIKDINEDDLDNNNEIKENDSSRHIINVIA